MIAPSNTPDAGFVCFAEWLRLSPAQTHRLYVALRTCGDREAKSVLFALQRFGTRRSQSGMLRDLARFGLGIGRPKNLIGVLERLTERGLLERNEASKIEDLLLSRVRADGHYK